MIVSGDVRAGEVARVRHSSRFVGWWAVVVAGSVVSWTAVVAAGPAATALQVAQMGPAIALSCDALSCGFDRQHGTPSENSVPVSAGHSRTDRPSAAVAAPPGTSARDGQDSEESPSENREIPLEKRWEIDFPNGTTQTQYARQLAVLGVELGVLRPDGTVQYVSHPGSADAQCRTGRRDDDRRLYWIWQQGDLQKADEALLKKAGVSVAGDRVLHFFPQETQDKLAALEKEFKGRRPIQILRTRFSLKRTARGYEVYVQEQTLRQPGRSDDPKSP